MSVFLFGVLGVVIMYMLFSNYGQVRPPMRRMPMVPPWVGLRKENREILVKYFPYYRMLPPKSKKIFERRIQQFILGKKFIPRNMPMVTAEMKMFIAASAIQLTFGLPDVYLQHFKYILVYPDEYYSTITKRYHKGEVNPRHQAIVLSWKVYVEGYYENEGINLGLHEMAHALHLENAIRNSEFDFLPEIALKEWDQLAIEEIEKIRLGEQTFFRFYGSTDRHEFFAVAVENFFERPREFEAYNGPLYRSLSKLLNQDPLLLSA